MRRKLFFYVLLLVISIFIIFGFAHNYGRDQSGSELEEKTYNGQVYSAEVTKDKTTNLIIKLESGDKILLKYYGKKNVGQYLYGSTIEFKSVLETPKGSRNPKCFDYRLYLKSINIYYTATTKDILIIKETGNLYHKWCRFLLEKKEAFLNSISEDDTRSFVDGILFGNVQGLEEDVYEQFKTNGTAHILAVSGLHIGIIYALVERLLGKKQSLLNLTITILSLLSLGILTGWTPSVIRAIGMIFIKIYAKYRDKRYDPLTALGLISFLMLIHNPYIVFNPSFQMSFLAAISIIFVLPHIPIKIPDFFAIILAVNVGLIPYQIYQFNTFSLTSFLANIPVVYLAGIMLPVAFAQFILFCFTRVNIDLIISAMSNLLISVNSFCTLNIEMFNVISPPLWLLVMLYLIGGFAISETCLILWTRKKKKTITMIIVLICLLCVVINGLSISEFDQADIVFVDVGQGDCLHIRDGDKDILIDGGGSTNYDVGRNTLRPYLLKNGVKNIDLAIATHMHTDHYKGLEELMNEGFMESVEVGLVSGKNYKVSDTVFIETLWPIEKNAEDINQDENRNCSVFMINYEGIKILVTGDLDESGEAKMLEYYKGTDKLKADILKVGHHGSKYSSSEEFLDEVNPKYSVIQVGKNNYGHPHMKIIENCRERCIILLRNDIHGAIGFSFDEGTIRYCTMI